MTTPDQSEPRWDQVARRWWEMLQNTRNGTQIPLAIRPRWPGCAAPRRRLMLWKSRAFLISTKSLASVEARSTGDFHALPPRQPFSPTFGRTPSRASGYRRRFAEMLGQGERPLMSPFASSGCSRLPRIKTS